MRSHRKMLAMAAQFAKLGKDSRSFCLGAMAIRDDETIVYAYNGNPHYPTPAAHCEARLVRKLDKGATVYLVRLTKNGEWANSKPCPDCMRALKRKYVKKIYYTIAPKQYDSLEP